MALQIKSTIGNISVFLDLYQDEPMFMSFSFAEIQDITLKNSAFSQSFKLPGTKTNNAVFDYYYDINSVPTNFNPNTKFPAIITWDGMEILTGNLRLESVVIDKDEIIYNTTFYNQVGNLSANIGDKFLRDLDLTHLQHPYSENVILQSQQDPNLFNLTGSTNYSYQNGKTMWGLFNIGYNYISGDSVNFLQTPLVNFTPLTGGTYTPLLGYFDNSGSPVWDYYFKPAIQVKELYESIFRDAGYEINSNFFDTAYFQRYYLPLKFLDDTPYTKGSTEACFTVYNQAISATSYLNYVKISGYTTCNSLSWGTTATSFTIQPQYPGNYTIKFTFDLIPTDICNPPTTVPSFFFIVSDGTTPVTVLSDQVCLPAAYNPQPYGVEYALTTTGGTFESYFIFDNCYVTGFTQTLVPPVPRFLVPGSTVDYAIEFPDNDYKQIDFVSSVNRYFNLVVVPDPDYPNSLIVEPIVDYIGKGDVLDWTTKVDRSQPIQVVPTSSIVNGTLDFDFRLDQDWANQTFRQAANRVFGTERKKLGLDYKDNVTKFETMFSSPLDITINPAYQQYATLPSFSKLNQKDVAGAVEQQFVPFKILPRLLFRGPVLSQETYGFVGSSGATPYQNWYVKAAGTGYTEDHFQIINRFTTYPFNYSGFSHYTNWRGSDQTTITPLEDTFEAEDLYDIYYDDYILDLTSNENKIVSAKIYLTPWEVKSLRFDEKILIDNTYYRINKIDKYNLLEPSICDIELIKLTREYTGHRKINYRFDPCTAPGDTLYSNSDLMFNAYAYIGRYVKLYTSGGTFIDCYQVYEDNANPPLGIGQQQKYLFGTGFTNTGVGIYDGCGCTGSTNMIVVQEP
jgi:hypothetical protein